MSRAALALATEELAAGFVGGGLTAAFGTGWAFVLAITFGDGFAFGGPATVFGDGTPLGLLAVSFDTAFAFGFGFSAAAVGDGFALV